MTAKKKNRIETPVGPLPPEVAKAMYEGLRSIVPFCTQDQLVALVKWNIERITEAYVGGYADGVEDERQAAGEAAAKAREHRDKEHYFNEEVDLPADFDWTGPPEK